jgi:hypothetical protein
VNIQRDEENQNFIQPDKAAPRQAEEQKIN